MRADTQRKPLGFQDLITLEQYLLQSNFPQSYSIRPLD